ncbi:hypothetical protein PJM23_29055, partial [Mycobacterium kansasii]
TNLEQENNNNLLLHESVFNVVSNNNNNNSNPLEMISGFNFPEPQLFNNDFNQFPTTTHLLSGYNFGGFNNLCGPLESIPAQPTLRKNM